MPAEHAFRTWDDYFIPGTAVLRNKLGGDDQPYGETDPGKLRTLEESATHLRLAQLAEAPIQGRFDYDHMKAIHQHLFQDVYEWAGQERVGPTDGPMTKDGHGYYPAGEALTADAHRQYQLLADKNLLRGLPQDRFVAELAESWGEVNVIHSFREGNTRTQFVFYSQLAEQAGYLIDTAQFAPGQTLRDEFVQARFVSQDTGRNDYLEHVLEQAVTPIEAATQERPDRPRVDMRKVQEQIDQLRFGGTEHTHRSRDDGRTSPSWRQDNGHPPQRGL